MTNLPCFLARLLVLSVLVVLAPNRVAAQPQGSDAAAVLFDDSQVPDIRLRINSKDWQALTNGYETDTYYPADLVWKDQTIRNVGIRSRGSGSRNPHKPGLRVDFNRYAAGQQFLGLTSVVLDNLYQDPAMIRERVAMKFYARMGLVAPRETFVKLWINDQIYLGVYALVESMDKRFLKHAGLDKDGFIYDYQYQDEWWFTHLGGDYRPYEKRFQPETNETASAAALYGPIEELVRTANEARQTGSEIEQVLDVRLFLRYLAVEAFLAEWDGLVGDFGINNFYLFRPSDGKQFVFLPWDRDNTFKSIDYPIWPSGMDNNVLTDRLMRVGELREFFLQAVLDCVTAAQSLVETPGGQPGAAWLTNEIDRQYSLIAEAALADNRKIHNNDRFQEEIALLRRFARERPAFARAAVARRR
jgi:spore coat protein CotH